MDEKMILTDEDSSEKPKNFGVGAEHDAGLQYPQKEKPRESIPSYFLFMLFGALVLLGYLTNSVEISVPNAVSDIEAGNTRFSEERAWRYLREIIGDGPRVAGTKYHLQKAGDLKALVDGIADTSTQIVHTDWQMASGGFWIGKKKPYLNAFENVSNIIALVEGASGFDADGSPKTSILFNCHYDTVPTSPGASDNALFCSALAETLYLLSRRTEKLKHNVVFLFNGAEENGLQGSSAFLKHPWSKNVKGMVNLDAAGMNAKSLLFQVTDPRVLAAYRRSVSRPNAQALGEKLFSAGIVPSDTDFRIFRSKGSIYGIDIAFYRMGYVYHTRHDALHFLQPGVLQHSGDLTYALAKEMGDSDDFYTTVKPSGAVFWDYMNLFMFSYSYSTANTIDTQILIFAATSVLFYHWIVGLRWTMTKELLISMLARILSMCAGVILLWILTVVMVSTTMQLRYLSHSWIIVPVFWLPYVIGAVFASNRFDAWRCKKVSMNGARRVAQAMASTRLLLCLVTFVLLQVEKSTSSRYLLTLPLLWMSASSYISLMVMKNFNLKAWQQVIMEFVLAVPCQMFMFMVAIKVNSLMVPVMGRYPAMTPDFMVAGLNTGLVILACIPLSGIELLFSRRFLWVPLGLTLLVSVVTAFMPFDPYGRQDLGPVLQRHYWSHTEIITYDQEGIEIDRRAGIWFAHTDVNVPQTILDAFAAKNITFDSYKTNFTEDCEKYLYCNLPMRQPVNIDQRPNSLWVDFSPPNMATPAPKFSLKNRSCDGNKCILEFSMTGPPVMSVAFSPREGVDVISWSFNTSAKQTMEWRSRPVYFIYYRKATYSDIVLPLEFSLTFSVPNATSNEAIVDLMFSAQRASTHENEFTREYRKLVNEMPDWFNIITYMSTRHNYVF